VDVEVVDDAVGVVKGAEVNVIVGTLEVVEAVVEAAVVEAAVVEAAVVEAAVVEAAVVEAAVVEAAVVEAAVVEALVDAALAVDEAVDEAEALLDVDWDTLEDVVGATLAVDEDRDEEAPLETSFAAQTFAALTGAPTLLFM